MKKILKINSDGYFLEDILVSDNHSIPDDCIEKECPQGFIRPKWNGNEWVEGGIIPIDTEEQKKIRYEKYTVKYIRDKYTNDDEYKILREKISGMDNDSFTTYNTYVEECKVKAYKEVYGN